MGWHVARMTSTPWYDLASTREVFDTFCEEEGLPKNSLPNLPMLRRSGRKDLIKGAEEWGGIQELAELLEYQVYPLYTSGSTTMSVFPWKGRLGLEVSSN